MTLEIDNVSVTAAAGGSTVTPASVVPEPSSLVLYGIGIVIAGSIAARQRKSAAK